MHVEDKVTGRQTFYLGAYQEERGGDLAVKGQVIGRYAFGPAHVTRVWTEADLGHTDTLSYTPPADHLGSTTLVTDTDGLPTDRRAYDTWGNERDSTNWTAFKAAPTHDLTTPVTGYTGHHERKQFGATAPGISGLVDMKARYYDPTAMRFLQPDTLIPNLFNPTDWNRLAYVNNSPTNFSDPTGHATQAPSTKADPTLDVSRLAYDFYVGAMSALDNYARANGMPTGVAASTIGHPFNGAHEESMAATRGRKPGGAQTARAIPLNQKTVEQMTQQEKFWYMTYIRDRDNYKAANTKAPFNNLEEYVVWRNVSVEAQAMGMNSVIMERMAVNAEVASGLVTGPILMHRNATKAAKAAVGTQVSPYVDDLNEFTDAVNDGIYAQRIQKLSALSTNVSASMGRTDLIAEMADGTAAKIGTLRANPKTLTLTAEVEGRFASTANLDALIARLQPYSELMSVRIVFRFPAALPDSIESMAGFDLPGMPFVRSFFGAGNPEESIVYRGYLMNYKVGSQYNRVDFYHPTLWFPKE